MGLKPSPEYSIERVDGNGNYEPTNCRWATRFEQGANKRNNHLVVIDGVTKCVSTWAREAGLDCFTIFKRLRCGESGTQLLRPRERTMINGEYPTCRKGLHGFPKWRRNVESGPYCVLCKRERDAVKRQQTRNLSSGQPEQR